MIHRYSTTDKPAGPRIHYFDKVSSTFDIARDLAVQGRLPVWDSVVAVSQTDGRGQMRRHWSSPKGNLYATIRLPAQAPFTDTAGTVAIGALLANALRSFGCGALMKWPNDIVVKSGRHYAKLAGILLEEREDILLAGIGVNVEVSPKTGESDCSLPAADMVHACEGKPVPEPQLLWQALARHFYSACKSGSFFSGIWHDVANELLLWRGQNVILQSDGECMEGELCGVSPRGGVLMRIGGETMEAFSGSLCQVETLNQAERQTH